MPKQIKDLTKRRKYQLAAKILKEVSDSYDGNETTGSQQSFAERPASSHQSFAEETISSQKSFAIEDDSSEVSNNDQNDDITQHLQENVSLLESELDYVQIEEQLVSSNPCGSSNTSETQDLKTELRWWLVDGNISQRKANSLIAILRRHGHEKELSKDVRTLLQTPRNATRQIVSGNGGAYMHFGATAGLKRSIGQYFAEVPDKISIQINCDGISISNSSSSQFWPLLIAIQANFYTDPFLVGLFHGFSKPKDANEYISPLVEEMKEILENGIRIEDKKVDVAISAFICDAPARAFLTLTKYHSGYFGCAKCCQEGEYDGCVYFPEIDNPLRTDESFKNMTQEEHHRGESILLHLNIGMVTQFPLDYMHLVCLGVVKRLVQFWYRGSRDIRLSKAALNSIDAALLDVKANIPLEFSREPRFFDVIDKWKATECRQFLLYSGPAILQNIIPSRKYNHFLALSIAIRILCDPQRCHTMQNYATQLLRWFVCEYEQLYGKKNLTYNVHNLIHLAAEVTEYGPLDQCSAFKFENYLGKLRRKVSDAPKPLEQITNRIHEELNIPTSVWQKINYPVIQKLKGSNKIMSLKFSGFILNNKNKRNNCCLLSDNTVLIIQSFQVIDNDVFVTGKNYTALNSLFLEPCDSKLIGIYTIDNYRECTYSLINVKASSVKCKCMYFSLSSSDRLFVIPLLQYNN